MWGTHFYRQFFLLCQVSEDILQVILQVMASSSSSSSIPADLESCEEIITDVKRAINLCGQEISSDMSEQTKARFIGCLNMLTQKYEQDFASISSKELDEFFEPLRSEILDHLPEFFEDDWLCWDTQMEDLCEYDKKKMVRFMVDRMKGKYPSITLKKQEMLKEYWDENQKRYKELVSEFGRLIDPIIEKVKYRFKSLKGLLVQRKKFIEQNALRDEKAKSKKKKIRQDGSFYTR